MASAAAVKSCLPGSEVTDLDVLAREDMKNISVVSRIKALQLWKAARKKNGMRRSLERKDESLCHVSLRQVMEKKTKHTGPEDDPS